MQKIGTVIHNPARLPRIGIIRLGLRDISGKSSEVDHFLFDTQDITLKRKISEIYGPGPKSLDVTFHTNDFETVFTCELQRWGVSKKLQSYLMCSGNGSTAREFGKLEDRDCPCNHLGNECRKKTMLRFLLPKVTMGGTFLLVTKSQYSTEIIETTLKMAKHSGGLMMRPFKLLRTEGFATVNNFKVKKYYLALLLDDAVTDGMSRSVSPSIKNERDVTLPENNAGLIPIRDFISPALPEWDDAMIARRERKRLQEGRDKVKRKLKLLIKDSRADAALEAYACDRFGRTTYNALSVQDLLVLWHDIGECREVLGAIHDAIRRL